MGLHILIEKSLVFISEKDTIEMHDLIQDMGKYVVNMQKDPTERSRLWNAEDFKEVMVNNKGTMAVEAIWFTSSEQIFFNKEAMKNMSRLRILDIWGCSYREDEYSSIELSNNLRWVVWKDYPWVSLPEKFEPQRLVHLDLRWSLLHDLWEKKKDLPYLRNLDLSYSRKLMRTPNFTGMPNLEYLNLRECKSLEEVHSSLRYCKKLIQLDLSWCESLKRFPSVRLENFPEIIGRMNPTLEIKVKGAGIRELPSSIFQPQAHLTELHLSYMKNLVALPSSFCMLKDLVKLDVSRCSKLKSLPEEIGDLENLETLNASHTLISRPPYSIVRLNKLKILNFSYKKLEDGVYFVFPQVNEGLRSLEHLDFSYCNIIDGGLSEDIGCLSSLKELHLKGNNFEHLPGSIAQLGALRFLDLSYCKRLKELPEFPEQLDEIVADWSNDWICNSLFQNISSLQNDISASDSLSLRVFCTRTRSLSTIRWSLSTRSLLSMLIPIWFHLQGSGTSVSVKLPENWYVTDNFLGFAVCCYSRKLIDFTAHLIPLSDDGMPCITRKLALSNHSEYSNIHFLLVPFAGLWDTSKANGKTPNDFRCIMLSFSKYTKYGFRLLYKDEAAVEALLQMRENNDEHCLGTRRSRYDEASCSSSKKTKVTLQQQLRVILESTYHSCIKMKHRLGKR